MKETPEDLSNILRQFIIDYNRTIAYPTQTTATPVYTDMDDQFSPINRVKITGSYLQGNYNSREKFDYERDLLYPCVIKQIDIEKASTGRFSNLCTLMSSLHPNLVSKVIIGCNGQVEYIDIYFTEPDYVSDIEKPSYTYFKKYSTYAEVFPEIVSVDSVEESYKKDKVLNEGKNWLSKDDIILYNRIDRCTYVPF